MSNGEVGGTWTADLVLGALAKDDNPVADLVRSFPGRSAATESSDWLDDWFFLWVQTVARGKAIPKVTVKASGPDGADLSVLDKKAVDASVRLLSIKPHYFRGFRALDRPILIDADLVVLQGRNSSGKTSISEALEWLVTGVLSRRETAELGDPRELENCISHQFRPANESTYVEATVKVGDDQLLLRRTLTQDYSAKKKSTATSVLTVDGSAQTPEQERAVIERLFAGVNPILMQHTLRQFVHDSPTHRRVYFERLLRIDELTALIEKAVIGAARLGGFPPPAGQVVPAAWAEVKRTAADPEVVRALQAAETAGRTDIMDRVRAALLKAAQLGYPEVCHGLPSLNHARERLAAEQERSRDTSFPLLATLRPRESRGSVARATAAEVQERGRLLEHAAILSEAQRAASVVSDAQVAVADAFRRLVAAGLIDASSPDPQTCPVCMYEEVPSLTAPRIMEIQSWTPISEALATAAKAWVPARTRYLDALAALERLADNALPAPLSDAQRATLSDAAPDLAAAVSRVLREADRLRPQAMSVKEAVARGRSVIEEMAAVDDVEALRVLCEDASSGVDAMGEVIRLYDEAFQEVDDLVAKEARGDERYAAREAWLTASADPVGVGESLLWERAKVEVQDFLGAMREGLIELRTALIDDVRERFSADMSEVWDLLRKDQASRFSRLHIPPARGRGYKLEFGVKAIIRGATEDKEVDALRVMSESQINVIGIAAYVTRARRLGHTVLVFDDPVQSMDEEHYRSFAATLLPWLIDQGFQVVIFTHSDQFARDISHQHYLRDSYVTLFTRGSRRQGCQVDEGNRRVTERLHVADKAAEEGKLDEAWKYVRLAIERLYTLSVLRNNDSFDPEQWRDVDAVHMWENGAGEIIESVVSDAGVRLREILTFAAAGAHDKPARGETDIRESTQYIRGLLTPLRLGDG